jgi:NAD(P)-dependent dehydrogenase (short-subunit alcohol dehydrogenase family)
MEDPVQMTHEVFLPGALAGKSILVTGGGSGLGREISRALLAKGASVHICGRRAGVLDEAVRDIAGVGAGRIAAHVCDIRDADAVEALVDGIWKEGPLTGLVNNAAANFIAPTQSLSARAFRAITSTVMDGSFHTTLTVGKRWIDRGLPGSVVSNLVTWVWSGSAFVVPSAMAKSALDAMTKSLAVEWGPYGIRLNAIAPGPFPTQGAWERLDPIPEAKSSVTNPDKIPLRRFGKMAELQNLVAFLLSDACDYLTGQTIAIDGAQHLAGLGTFADLSRLTKDDWRRVRTAIQDAEARERSTRSP